MKLIRFGEPGNEKPGIISQSGERLDLSGHFPDWNGAFFSNEGVEQLGRLLGSDPVLPVVADGERWAACVARPYKILCIGLNYSDHAHESGMPIPQEPIVFQKASNTVVGPYDPVYIPKQSTKTDWEVELGIIIKKEASYLQSPDQARDHIAGYCVSHDVSERAFQLERGGQWTKGKSCKSFNPLGPFLLTVDEDLDPQALDMKLKVNNQLMQYGNTNTMIFDCNYLVWYLSQFMVLEPGDLINTGTPPGVGMGKNPQIFLKEGDVVELGIEGLGIQRQTFVGS